MSSVLGHSTACPWQVVFVGLDIVVPLISDDLLKIPKLCRLYFGLLGYMLEAFPERMAALPGANTSAQTRFAQVSTPSVPMLHLASSTTSAGLHASHVTLICAQPWVLASHKLTAVMTL